METFKFVAVGDSLVGKTCLLKTYADNIFPESQMETIYNDYSKRVTVDGVPFKIDLYDTAGKDSYDRLRPISYPNTDLFLICFSIADPDSLENVRFKWNPEVSQHYSRIPKILIGTKLDLRNDPTTLENLTEKKLRPINQQQANAMAKKIRASKYMECSALTRTGLDEVFTEAHKVAVDCRRRRNTSCCILL